MLCSEAFLFVCNHINIYLHTEKEATITILGLTDNNCFKPLGRYHQVPPQTIVESKKIGHCNINNGTILLFKTIIN